MLNCGGGEYNNSVVNGIGKIFIDDQKSLPI